MHIVREKGWRGKGCRRPPCTDEIDNTRFEKLFPSVRRLQLCRGRRHRKTVDILDGRWRFLNTEQHRKEKM